MLSASHLYRSFGATQAVNDLSLSVQRGEIYGLVGPDGAGKTTTLRLLCGALQREKGPDGQRGSVTLGGYDLDRQPEQVRAQIGYLSQGFSLYDDLTVLENIRFLAEVRGLARSAWLERTREILAFVGLDSFEDRLAGRLSGGMRQKLSLAAALVNRPNLLLLDEPTTGVDPVTRQDFWQLIIRLAARKELAVVVCTPYMDEAARCTRIGYLRSGKMVVEGMPRELRARLDGRVLELAGNPEAVLLQAARSDPGVEDAQRFGDRLHLRIAPNQAGAVRERLLAAIPAAGGMVERLETIQSSLEDVFIELSAEQSQEGKVQ